MPNPLYQEVKSMKTKKYILYIFIIVELFVIINNNHSTKLTQKKYDQEFIQYMDLSNNALQLDGSPDYLKDNRIYAAASDISSALALFKYTSYFKENSGLGGMLENYHDVFINVSLDKLISNNKTFITYMDDILKNPHSKDSIDKFTTYLIKLQRDVENLKK